MIEKNRTKRRTRTPNAFAQAQRCVLGSWWMALAAAGAVAACGGTELEPAQSANDADEMAGAIETRNEGIELTARAGDWPGDAEIGNEVTPMHVVIQNRSQEAIKIRYTDFELNTENGVTYEVIPPLLVSGVVEKDVEGVQPGFTHDRFYVAPHYGVYYPTMYPYAGSFAYDPYYYSNSYGYWDTTTALPTNEMLRRALPEGVIEPGGSLDGYLYFEKVSEDQEGNSVWLQAQLPSAANDRLVATVQLEFKVD